MTAGGRSAPAAPRPGQLSCCNKESGRPLALPATPPDKRTQNRTAASASARTHGLGAPVRPWPQLAGTRRAHGRRLRLRFGELCAAPRPPPLIPRGGAAPLPRAHWLVRRASGRSQRRPRRSSALWTPSRAAGPKRCPVLGVCSAPFKGLGLQVPGSAWVLAGPKLNSSEVWTPSCRITNPISQFFSRWKPRLSSRRGFLGNTQQSLDRSVT